MEEFSFPFPPYDVQLNLMREIKDTINNGEVGIFESPTGTGKSLSVLCATMTWLEEEERAREQELERKAKQQEEQEEQGDDWIRAHQKKAAREQEKNTAKDELEIRKAVKDKIARAKAGVRDDRKRKQADDGKEKMEGVEGEEDELAPPLDYDSDGEKKSEWGNEEAEKPLAVTKILYASRTHSQLEQLIDELQKTRFRPRIVTTASRQQLCANDEVRNLKSTSLINDRCMELRKGRGGEKAAKEEDGMNKKKCGSGLCSYYRQENIEEVSSSILAGHTQRVSQVWNSGRLRLACPYFASRAAVNLCELVLLPYQTLLHPCMRAAWGIQLQGNVIILDEAHNVLQTIGSLFSVDLSLSALTLALSLIRQYIDTYRLKLKAKNLVYMRQLLSVVTALERLIRTEGAGPKGAESVGGEEVLTIQQLVIKLELLDVNLFKLVDYIERTDLCKKFHGFHMRTQKSEVKAAKTQSGVARLLAKKKTPVEEAPPTSNPAPSAPAPSPLFAVKAFLESLNNVCEDGRIIIVRSAMETKYRFVLLNPASKLSHVVQQARSCILVGGTMEPAGILVDAMERRGTGKVRRFTCEHVIGGNQLAAIAIGHTQDERPFTLTYQTRSDEKTVSSLCDSLFSLVSAVPNGVVVFLPSYDYLAYFSRKMTEKGVMRRLQERKVVLMEERGGASGGGASLMDKFATAARTTKGAVLMAVVGGKLSEGINFSDDLGRAVVMVGLPFPNKNSVELKEKMKYLDCQSAGRGMQLYESLCMHAVNQAIGRAIRHRHDYAAVILLDSRFATPKVSSQLSGWIGSRLRRPSSFREALQTTVNFFRMRSQVAARSANK